MTSEIIKTAFVLVTDNQYFHKARTTINDLRTVGKWSGDLLSITIDFNLDEQYKIDNNIIEHKFPCIDKTNLLQKIGPNGFENSDKRELYKLNQWEKLHVFDNYFLTQNDSNKVLLLYGVTGLTILGSVELVKSILQKTAGIIKFLLVAAFVYYLVVIVLGFDILGLIFN
jgi:hypothetical protein